MQFYESFFFTTTTTSGNNLLQKRKTKFSFFLLIIILLDLQFTAILIKKIQNQSRKLPRPIALSF